MLSTTGGARLEPVAYTLATSGDVHNHVTAVGDGLVIVQARTIDGAVHTQRERTTPTHHHDQSCA
jgi:hypothetical protein